MMHVAIVPDGLRRWAKINGESYDTSYTLMCVRLRDYVVECFSTGIDVVSLYLSARVNFSRSQSDIDAFCVAESRFYADLLPPVAKEFDAKVVNAGSIDVLPEYLQQSARQLARDTSHCTRRKLYLCVAYNPIDEIRHAFTTWDGQDDILNLLWVSDPVDLLIRTGCGELASSFLPLQCAGRAKIYSLDKLFLETSVQEIRIYLKIA